MVSFVKVPMLLKTLTLNSEKHYLLERNIEGSLLNSCKTNLWFPCPPKYISHLSQILYPDSWNDLDSLIQGQGLYFQWIQFPEGPGSNMKQRHPIVSYQGRVAKKTTN